MASDAVIPSSAAAMVAGAAPFDPHQHQPHHQQQQPAWLMDERDGFISWLRGEFAAANAIIDLLVLHLRTVPGEYDHVFAAVQQRRHHWAHIIHMQQFFPVTDVALALQHSEWLRRSQPPHPQPPQQHGPGPVVVAPNPPPPPARRHNNSYAPSHNNHRHGGGSHRPDPPRPAANGVATAAGSDKDGRELHNQEGKGLKEGENVVDAKSLQLDSPITDEGEKDPQLQTNSEGSSKVAPAPLEYTTSETMDGKPVNTVEGLKVYEGLVNVIEINKLVSLANETKASFRRGGLEAGQTVIVGRRPLRGHGSSVIQLGVPIIDGPFEDENQRETRVEAVPGLLQDLFDRFFQQGIVPSKPDYCVIDFFNEGEYSHPQQPPPWYGRPLCTLCLTECDMVFGRVISGERGDNRGPLKLSLSTGSLLVLQGRSADVAKRSIPATHKQRILLTFGKSVPRKLISPESATRVTPTLGPPPMPWGPPSRPANMRPHSPSPKHFGYVPASSVLPAPTAGPLHIPPSDGMQPLFVAPAPVAAAAIPFPAAVPLSNTAPAWIPEAAPRPPPPRLPVPGTGVFLPPGSGHKLLPPHQMIQAHAEPNSPKGLPAYAHNKATGMEMANGNASPRSSATTKRPDTIDAKPDSNGSSNGGSSLADEKSAVLKEQQNGGMKKAGNSKAEPSAAK